LQRNQNREKREEAAANQRISPEQTESQIQPKTISTIPTHSRRQRTWQMGVHLMHNHDTPTSCRRKRPTTPQTPQIRRDFYGNKEQLPISRALSREIKQKF